MEEKAKNAKEERDKADEDLVKFNTLFEEQERMETNFGPSSRPGVVNKITGSTFEDQFPQSKLIYMADELKGKTPEELAALGVNDAQKENGTGWYKLNILERDQVNQKLNELDLQREIEKLILENGELASHLEKSNDMLNIYRDMKGDKRESEKLDLEILEAQIKAENEKISDLQRIINQKMADNEVQYVEDVEYDDNADMFSISESDKKEATSTNNFFDLFIEFAEFDRDQITELIKIKRIADTSTAPKILFMVEFYNHDSVTSQLYQELRLMPNFQASFAVQLDKYFLNYCMTQCLQIECYGLIGAEKIKLGEADFPLAELMQRNAACLMKSRNLCAVIKRRQEINNSLLGRPIGQMSAVYRMRRPCGVTAKLHIEELAGKQFAGPDTGMKKLVIRILNVTGLRETIPTFIAYTLYDGITYYTNTVRGPDPVFNFSNTHDILLTQDLKNRIVSENLDFVIFDESKPATTKDNSDIIGMGSVNLSNLVLKGEMFEDTVPLFNKVTKTNLYVRVLAYFFKQQTDEEYYDLMHKSGFNDSLNDSMMTPEQRNMMMTSMDFGRVKKINANTKDGREIAKEFATTLRNKGISLAAAFETMDKSNLS